MVAGALLSTTESMMTEMRALQETGIAGVVVTTPYYYRPTPAEASLHFRALAQRARIPLIVYNVPVRTGTALTVPQIEEIRSIGKYVSIKDSSLNFAHMQALIHALSQGKTFTVTDGSEENWVASALFGAHGATLGIANICPRWCAQAWSFVKEGQWQQANWVNRQILELRDAIFFNTSSVYGGLKEALHLLGFGGRTMSLPLIPLREDEHEEFAQRLRSFAIDRPVDVSAAAGSFS
jgi:4-hydroxy-tetrahydrodipicolinate synthase